jgi:hypothetical protein
MCDEHDGHIGSSHSRDVENCASIGHPAPWLVHRRSAWQVTGKRHGTITLALATAN